MSPSAKSVEGECRIEIVRDLGQLDALEYDWNSLAHRCGNSRIGFQSFAWIRSWLTHYADARFELHIVLGYYDGRLALIWPLGAKKTFGLTILEFLGEPLCQYHDALIDADAPSGLLLATALGHLASLRYDMMRLRRVREDSKLTPALLAAGARIVRRERAPFIDFAAGESPDTFERALSAKARSNRRRRLRRLAELGEISHESDVPPRRAAELIEVALGFKRQWALKGGCYAPAIFDPRFEECLRDAAWERNPDASLRVFALLCAGRPIGVEISLAYKERLYAHVLAHDPELAKLGVGTALADASIGDAYAHGYRLFDLLAPADPFKSDWARGEVTVNDFLLSGTRRGALFGFAKAGVIHVLRKAVTRAPRIVPQSLMLRAEHRRVKAILAR